MGPLEERVRFVIGEARPAPLRADTTGGIDGNLARLNTNVALVSRQIGALGDAICEIAAEVDKFSAAKPVRQDEPPTS
jgi:hypothetical protein